MPEKGFEHIIREKLLALSVDLDPADWSRMAKKMESQATKSTPSNAGFDAIFKEKLSSGEAGIEPADWEAMQGLLDHPATEPVPVDDLDSQIVEKLSDHRVPFTPRDWQKMEQLLDGTGFYAAIRDRLDELDVPFKRSDWSIMEDRLNFPFYHQVREKLGGHQSNAHMRRDWRMMARQLRAAGMRPLAIAGISLRYVSVAATILILLLSYIGLEPVRFYRLGPTAEQFQAYSRVEPNSADVEIPARIAEKSLVVQASAPLEAETNTAQTEGASFVTPELALDFENLNEAEVPAIETRSIDDPEPVVAVFLPMPAMPFSQVNKDLDLNVERFDERRLRRVPEISLGLIGSYVSTKVELTDPGENGYSTGLRLQVRLNDFLSIVSGIQYAEKHFSHDYYVLTSERFNWHNGMDGHFAMVEIPIMLRYDFPSQTKLNLYMLGGVTPMITLRERYIHYDITNPANSSFRGNEASDLTPEDQARQFNTYVANLQGGLGLSYQLNNRLSLFTEPYFQVGLQKTKSSVGREQKNLFSLGAGLGILYRITP